MTKTASLSPELLLVLAAVPDPYLILSPDLTILTASKAYLEVTLIPLVEMQGKHIFEVFPDNPDFVNANGSVGLRQSLEWVVQHKEPHKTELRRYDLPQPEMPNIYKEKYWRTVNHPVLDEQGRLLYIIHKVEDATSQVMSRKREERKLEKFKFKKEIREVHRNALKNARAEAELERMKLHHLLMQAPALICIYEGPEHVYKLVNPLYQKMVGGRPILGKPIAEAMPELAGQPIFELLDQVYRTGETYYAHEMLVHLDHDNSGKLGDNYYNFIHQATYNLEGEIDGILVFAYEVTAQVVARREVEEREQALQVLNLQLRVANEEIQLANSELARTQLALQDLNQELETRVLERTRALQSAQAEMEAQRNRLQQLFMHAPFPISILAGEDLVFELVNPAYQQLLPGRKLKGSSMLNEAIQELASQPFAKVLRQVYRTGEKVESREELIPVARYEGGPLEERYFDYVLQPRLNELSEVDGVIIFVYEVTEQVEARQAVEQSAQQLQLITDALPVLIGYLDTEEKYQFANKAYESWFPLKAHDLLGKPVREVVGEEAYLGVKPYIDRALSGERLDFESKMPYRENFTKYIRTSYVPDQREGRLYGFYTLVNDITDQVLARQQMEQREQEAKALTRELALKNAELRAANEQLKHTNIDLDNFIYTASHDLKAPIYNIEGLLKILLESIPAEAMASPEMKNIIRMIENSISRFKRTIEHLTEVTKLQKENSKEAVVVDLAVVFEDVKLDLSAQLKAANARLDTNIAHCPAIQFSEKNLRSVIYNLLSNAIKYRDPERPLHIAVECHPETEFAVLTVKDNGLGMDLEGNQKLFSMFGRLHDHVEGSGIGLYMVKKIVENADGRIEVESKVGVGSTFRVYLKI